MSEYEKRAISSDSFGYLEIERVTNERKTWVLSRVAPLSLALDSPQPSDPVVFF